MNQESNPSFESELALLVASGGVYPAQSVHVQPDCMLSSWSIREATQDGKRERFFVGRNDAYGDGRVSTAIVTFDKATMTGTTKSGRHYGLRGESGACTDADYVWARYVRVNQLTDIKDVSDEYSS